MAENWTEIGETVRKDERDDKWSEIVDEKVGDAEAKKNEDHGWTLIGISQNFLATSLVTTTKEPDDANQPSVTEEQLRVIDEAMSAPPALPEFVAEHNKIKARDRRIEFGPVSGAASVTTSMIGFANKVII